MSGSIPTALSCRSPEFTTSEGVWYTKWLQNLDWTCMTSATHQVGSRKIQRWTCSEGVLHGVPGPLLLVALSYIVQASKFNDYERSGSNYGLPCVCKNQACLHKSTSDPHLCFQAPSSWHWSRIDNFTNIQKWLITFWLFVFVLLNRQKRNIGGILDPLLSALRQAMDDSLSECSTAFGIMRTSHQALFAFDLLLPALIGLFF